MPGSISEPTTGVINSSKGESMKGDVKNSLKSSDDDPVRSGVAVEQDDGERVSGYAQAVHLQPNDSPWSTSMRARTAAAPSEDGVNSESGTEDTWSSVTLVSPGSCDNMVK